MQLTTNLHPAWPVVLVLAAFGCGGTGSSSHDVSGSEPPPPRAGERAPEPGGAAGSEPPETPASAGRPSMEDTPDAAPAGARSDATVDAGTTAAPRAFRLTEISLRDPHFFLGTTDITDQELLGASVNGSLINDGLTMDFDGDGFIDVSIVAAIAAFDPAAPSGDMRMVDARCPPDEPTRCSLDPNGGLDAAFTIENRAVGTCLEPIAGTTSDYAPAVTAPSGPCFVTTEGRDLTIDLGGIRIAMTACSLAARYDASSPDRLVDGLIAGFVTDTSAMEALLPSYLPLLAGSPVSDFLSDDDHDLEQSPTGENGFWLYLNFEAEAVDFDDSP